MSSRLFDDLLAGEGTTISLRRCFLERRIEAAEERVERNGDAESVAYLAQLRKQLEDLHEEEA